MSKKLKYILFAFLILGLGAIVVVKKSNIRVTHSLGDKIDSFNGVSVFYNGKVGTISGRNLTADGYNLGLKFQCVEFVKRYYFEQLDHKMPDSYGHSKDFFDRKVADGGINKRRNLYQYPNSSKSKPRVNDLIIFDANIFNKFGHVAIISKVKDNEIEIIQQNPGPIGSSRETFKLVKKDNKWKVKNGKVLGWLRKK